MIRLDYKIRKASTHDFGKKVSSCVFFGTKWALTLCLMIIQLENKPSQSTKFCILHSRHIYNFFTRVKPCVCAKSEISSYSVFERTGPTSDGHLVEKIIIKKRKQALLDENTKIMFFFQLVCTGLYQSFSRDWQVCTGNQFVNHFIVNQ